MGQWQLGHSGPNYLGRLGSAHFDHWRTNHRCQWPRCQQHDLLALGRWGLSGWGCAGWHHYQTAFPIPAGDIGSWVHLAGLYNGGEWLLYRNGQLVSRATASVGAVTNRQQWTVGAIGLTPSRFLAAKLDDLLIYNRQLPMATIRALAQPVSTAALTALEVGFLPLQAYANLSQISWFPATFLDPSSFTRRWSLVVPAGLEGPYRLYLRASDAEGNLSDSNYFVWQGEIPSPRAFAP